MSVRNWRTKQVEIIEYITPDGVHYRLTDPPRRSVLFYEGDGIPEASFDTRVGPFQHGESVSGYRLKPRSIDMVVRMNGCSREEYITRRRQMTDMFRHSRTDDNDPEPGILRRYLADGSVRDIAAYISKPPIYTFPKSWDHFSVNETLQFYAANPIAFDPTSEVVVVSDFQGTPVSYYTLQFPITFPITFNTLTYTTITKTQVITYEGDWEEYPTITVTGPGNQLSIVHVETGDKIALLPSYVLAVGEVVTIDLTYGDKTITSNINGSIIGYLTDDSNLARFRLLPHPKVTNGVNTFEISMIIGTPQSSVTFTYKNRYEAV